VRCPECRAGLHIHTATRRRCRPRALPRAAVTLLVVLLVVLMLCGGPIRYLEWTYQGNLQTFAQEGSITGCPGFLTAGGYDVVLVLVSCPDIEGVVRNAAKRERTIPPDTIRKYNTDRTKHFVEALNTLRARRPPPSLRAFVVRCKDHA
jgi:hypothetical protein